MLSKEQIKLFEKKGKENKIIEQYSVKNYFVRVLLNYDPSKIKFFTKESNKYIIKKESNNPIEFYDVYP